MREDQLDMLPTVSVPRPEPQSCSKCGGAAEFLTSIPRLGEQPAYRIFECLACEALTWIAEAQG